MEVLFSLTGSEGNASIISDENTLIQIDTGIGMKKVNAEIDYKINNISAIIITHAHSDHISHLKDYLMLGRQIYAPQEVWDKMGNLGAYKRYCKTIQNNVQFKIGTFLIVPFEVKHINTDGTDCENYGFLIYSTITKEKMLWVTDCAYINNTFPTLNYICIECNYVDIENYADELDYLNVTVEKRRLNSHLSLNRCISFLEKQDLSKIKFIKLLHLTKNQGKIDNIILDKIKSNEKLKNIEVIM